MKNKDNSWPIDIVYLWTDGADTKFNNVKNKYLQKIKKTEYLDDVNEQIYRDNNELKYSLRSIEKNAQWINHIYIVTGFNQVPKWLKTNHPKITVIPQESILPKDAGPIFNSCAIEMCVANIPGLNEHFLLANDDMFFNMPVSKDYFFDKNGKSNFHCIYRKNGRLACDKHSIYSRLLINSAREIWRAFGVNLYNYKSSHGIDAYLKSSIQECCKNPILSQSINKTKYSMFRKDTDVHHLIFDLYNIVKNKNNVIISHSRHYGHNIILDFLYNLLYRKSVNKSVFFCNDAIKSNVLKIKSPIVCINDSFFSNNITRENNKNFYEIKFPEKSGFEK